MTPDPHPRLDEQAVEAAARELARMVSPPPYGTLESAAERALAAYFAARDREVRERIAEAMK